MLKKDLDWMITKSKMNLTNNAKFMHCLPIRRNVVASDEVIESNNSLILNQVENRIYSAQSVLKQLLRMDKLTVLKVMAQSHKINYYLINF